MTVKSTLFDRIREALRVPRRASHPLREHAQVEVKDFREWLPHPGENPESWRKLFREKSIELKIEFIEVPDHAGLASTVVDLAKKNGWKKIAIHGDSVLSEITQPLGLPIVRTEAPYAIPDLENCDAGITTCEALIAQTGSVLVTSKGQQGRAVTILPPHHVVIATHDQLLPDLSAAFSLMKQKYSSSYPSMISFITGPSRTGDIERILVLGAHGPRFLTVILIAGTG